MRALKLPKFSGSSVKPFLLRSSFVMWERSGKLGGRLVRKFDLSGFYSETHLVNKLCERFTVITF